MPVIAAALARRAEGKEPVAPDPSLGHAADTLRMLRGESASEAEAKALDAYLVTVSDHAMNASTFAGRVIASTQADLFMAVTGAYCALTGPLHGGAPEPVLEMLDAIGTRERIAPWIDAAIDRGDRLMGFGHRIYRVRDPRADVLKQAVATLGVDRKRSRPCRPTSRPMRGPLSPKPNRTARSTPMWNSTRRSCSTRSRFRARRSRRSSPPAEPSAGPRTRSSSGALVGFYGPLDLHGSDAGLSHCPHIGRLSNPANICLRPRFSKTLRMVVQVFVHACVTPYIRLC